MNPRQSKLSSRTRMSFIAVTACAVLAVTVLPGSAQPDPEWTEPAEGAPPGAVTSPPEGGYYSDLPYEEEHGIGQADHELFDPREAEFHEFLATHEEHPNFAHAEYDRASRSAEIAFAGSAPAALSDTDVEFELIIREDADFPAETTAEIAIAIDDYMQRHGADAVSVRYARGEGRFEAVHSGTFPEEAKAKLPEAVTDRVNAARRNRDTSSNRSLAPNDVKMRYIERPDASDELHSATMIGGSWLGVDFTFECTAGNAVVKNGVRAILTADHCSGINRIRNHHYIARPAPFRSTANSKSWGDMEIHDLPESQTVSDNFYRSSGTASTDPGSSIGGLTTSSQVCTFGQATGSEQCSPMHSLNVTNGGYGRLALMQGCITQPGDSGAPVYTSDLKVVGIVQGCAPYGFSGWGTTFSRLIYVDDAFAGFDVYFD